MTIGVVFLVLTVLTTTSPQAKAFILNNLVPSCLVATKAAADGPTAQYAAIPATAPAKEAGPEAPLAPAVLFTDSKGKTIDISKQRGKVLFINFWATWCPPCIAEMPSIAKLQSQLNSKDILFLMVDVDKNFGKSVKFMDKNGYQLPVYQPAGEVPAAFLSGAIPTTVVIDKAGRVVGRHEGGADYANPEVVQYFADLIKQ